MMTGKITSKLNLILSEYPEDTSKFKILFISFLVRLKQLNT